MVHGYVFYNDIKAIISLGALSLWIALTHLIKTNITKKVPNKSFSMICFFQAILFLLLAIAQSSETFLYHTIYIGVAWLVIYLIINSIRIEYFVPFFIKANILSLLITLIGVILVVLKVSSVISIVPYQNGQNIFNYGFFFIKRVDENIMNLRPGGYYDEPGSLAYIVMFLLLINKKYYKNRRWENLLLFMPLIALSLAHIITCFLFISVFNINRKNIKYLLIAIALFGIATYQLQIYKGSDQYINYIKAQSLDRFTGFIVNQEDVGRGAGYAEGPHIFSKHPFGLRPELLEQKYPKYVPATFWTPLIQLGILGIWIYLLPFVYFLLVKVIRDRSYINFGILLIIAANMAQRPQYIYPLYYILIYILFFDPMKIQYVEVKRSKKLE